MPTEREEKEMDTGDNRSLCPGVHDRAPGRATLTPAHRLCAVPPACRPPAAGCRRAPRSLECTLSRTFQCQSSKKESETRLRTGHILGGEWPGFVFGRKSLQEDPSGPFSRKSGDLPIALGNSGLSSTSRGESWGEDGSQIEAPNERWPSWEHGRGAVSKM